LTAWAHHFQQKPLVVAPPVEAPPLAAELAPLPSEAPAPPVLSTTTSKQAVMASVVIMQTKKEKRITPHDSASTGSSAPLPAYPPFVAGVGMGLEMEWV
jgi:hypothetical protein